jgi:predicted membrane protein
MPIISLAVALAVIAVIAWLINGRLPLPEQIRTILNVVMALIVVGIALWAINTYIPMAGSIKAILNIVVVIASIVKVLQAVGLWDGIVRLWNTFRYRVGKTDTASGQDAQAKHSNDTPRAA